MYTGDGSSLVARHPVASKSSEQEKMGERERDGVRERYREREEERESRIEIIATMNRNK